MNKIVRISGETKGGDRGGRRKGNGGKETASVSKRVARGGQIRT